MIQACSTRVSFGRLRNGFVRTFSSLLLVLVTAAPQALSAKDTGHGLEQRTDYYRVVDGRVDPSTMLGWRIFHNACFGCHGVGAVGTDVAPDLTQRIKRLSPVEFAMTVLSRYRVMVAFRENVPDDQAELAKEVERRQHGPRGQITMPAWESNASVKPHILDLYAYLRARADGAIGPGRPEPLAK